MSLNCAKDLTELWIKAEADPSNTTLMPVEADAVRKVLRMSKSEVNLKLDEIMTMRTLQDFLEVQTQIKSLEIFWSRIVQKKKIRDIGRSNPYKFGMDQQQCLIGLQVIPRRLSIGLSDIAPPDPKLEKKIKELLSQVKKPGSGHEESARATNLGGDHGSETTEDEPERGRTTKRSTRPGKAFRDASEESAARRRKHAAQDCVAKDSTSEESSMAQKRKRRGRQRTRRKGKSAEDSTSADSGTSDDHITAVKEAKSAVAEHSRSDSYKTGQSRLDSSASEESTVSGKTTHRGRRTTKASRRQQWQTEIPREKRTVPASSSTGRSRDTSKGLTQRTRRQGKTTDDDYGFTAE